MVGILLFMSISLFLYTILLKHYNITRCPMCSSNKITIEESLYYRLFTCKTCRFSYKDYYSFYFLTPINRPLEVILPDCDSDNLDE